MEIAVQDAARRLGLSDSRVRQLLAAGDLVGRRVGRSCLVDGDEVARLQGQRRRPGRPAGPRRAWGILDLLAGGRAAWLSPSERSQVRSFLANLDEPDADEWRSILRGRSESRPVRAHPAAIVRLAARADVLPAGPEEAVRRGFDLVGGDEARQNFYVPLREWATVAGPLALEPSHDGNLVIRHPMRLWPFHGCDHVSDAVIAADLLHEPGPRAVRAGELRLNALLRDLGA